MMKKILFTVLLLIHMCIIFNFSMQPAESSGNQSKNFTITVLNILPGINQKTYDEKVEIAENIDFYIRKCAHFSIYSLLGILAFAAFFCYDTIKNSKYKYLYLMMFCLLYAVSDEIHQYFVPGRACRAFDVGIDFCGSCLGIYVAYCVSKIFNENKK